MSNTELICDSLGEALGLRFGIKILDTQPVDRTIMELRGLRLHRVTCLA